jgi:hypothetical protein
MDDQYGNPVPDDLAMLDLAVDELDDAQIAAVDRLDWYQPACNPNTIVVSGSALADAMLNTGFGQIVTTDPEEYECKVRLGVQYIAASLHRWSDEDGFYHA